MFKHVLQSELWQEFKNSFGTPAIMSGGVLYTKHKIPFTNYYYAYSPRVNPFSIDFDTLRSSLEGNQCVAIHFDVPNIIKNTEEELQAQQIFRSRCTKSMREEFAKANFLLDLNQSEDIILQNMHNKQRYNINYSIKKGVKVRKAEGESDFNIFYSLYKETGNRQGFYFRSEKYLKKVWEIFSRDNSCDILIAEYEGKPLSSWMLVTYDNILYYPYGGSTENMKNLQANCLIGWEAIKYGKLKGCSIFDMWGASEDLNDTKDPYFGFSQFKAKYGGKHVLYMDSFDFILNPPAYKMFNLANNLRWKVLNLLR